MPKHIYIFSGLGADERVFQLLSFHPHEVHFVQWIPPLANDNITSYATRLLAQIKIPQPILIGLSFGGMVAIEISKQIPIENLILISSAKTKYEIPLAYRIAGKLRLHRLVPNALFLHPNPLTFWFFGAATGFEKELLSQILCETDPLFLPWAIHQILLWKNKEIPSHTFHIHGQQDRILPISNIQSHATIPKGGHFMILQQAETVNAILNKLM